VSVFSPDDLALVKEGPSERRRYLDDVLVGTRPGLDPLRGELDRVLRQRNALLRQAATQHRGKVPEDVALTLAVWDDKLVSVGEELAARRVELLDELTPALTRAYRRLAGGGDEVRATYESTWRDSGLAAALADARRDELRRGVSLVGPHRDDVMLSIAGLPARTHASQGEQRSLALALRLAAHVLVAATIDTPPVLLLDDVLSELDPARAAALLEQVRGGQTLLTTAGALPAVAQPDAVLTVRAGAIDVA
jgi:DNA replication and repair protein RecF